MKVRHAHLLKNYFLDGFAFMEIQQLLQQVHNIELSVRHLRRVANNMGLYKRKQSSIHRCIDFIHQTISRTGSLHGYRWMHLKCIRHGLVISRETVRRILKLIDPINVALRRNKTLRRREYESHGPNEIWHMDGYDKLKPFGIAIHGCIDGFSRNVLWLEAGTTNNDPKIIGGYFVRTILNHEGCPMTIRCDYGTENGHVEHMQRFLRRHARDALSDRCFIYGSSTHNQRIESFWALLRRKCTQFWIELFHQLKVDGHFSGSFLDRNLIGFCFLNLVQGQLIEFTNEWNAHQIRHNVKSNGPTGRPVVMYTSPELYGTVDHICPVEFDDLSVCFDECRFESHPCDKDVFDLCEILMSEVNWVRNNDPFDSVDLYIYLRNVISMELFRY